MRTVTIFVGSAHKGNTLDAAKQFVANLQSLGDVTCETVTLSDYDLRMCRGCRLCMERGEQLCPLKDDRDVLMDKIAASDGVVLATPNYCFQVSGITKVFLDRFGYVCNRPRYFGKAFTSIVTQGIHGGDKIVSYLDFAAGAMGFGTVKGVAVTALDPRTEKDQQRIDTALSKLARRYHARLMAPSLPSPTVFELMIFRMSRTSMLEKLDDTSCDYRYYRDQGWFETDFYYPVRLGSLKKGLGKLFDATAPAMRRLMA